MGGATYDASAYVSPDISDPLHVLGLALKVDIRASDLVLLFLSWSSTGAQLFRLGGVICPGSPPGVSFQHFTKT